VLIAAVSIVMVTNLSTTAYVAVHPLVSWAVLGLVIAVAIPFFQQELRQVASAHRPALTSTA
jgi:hypothetical protein